MGEILIKIVHWHDAAWAKTAALRTCDCFHNSWLFSNKEHAQQMGKPKVIRMEAKHTKHMCLYVISCIYTSVNIIKYTIQTMSYK